MSQCQKILRVLAQGKTLTTMGAMRMLGVTTLSQRCGELRRQGWPIASIRAGKSHHHVYFIPAAKAALVRRKMERA